MPGGIGRGLRHVTVTSYAVCELVISLRRYAAQLRRGVALDGSVACLVTAPHRRLFTPDAGFHTGEMLGEHYIGAPVLAIHVRGKRDYGPLAERRIAQRREDYFAARAEMVWDVDVLREEVVRVYRAARPSEVIVYRCSMLVDGGPELPGWTIAVNDLFP